MAISENNALSAQDIADYFLSNIDEESGDNVSNLKLQKLLYYAQGFHLALFGKPLFEEAILAWQHGPVVPEIYHRFKHYAANALPPPEKFDRSKYAPAISELLDEILSVYGQYSALKLRSMTHEEPPWSQTAINHRIPDHAMRDFFKTLVVDGTA